MGFAIVVLGSPNDESGILLPIAISRCEKTLSEYNKRGDCKILCTGGFGQHFNTTDIPHGKYAQDYLERKGIPFTSFLEVALSSFTLEDAILSKPILENNSITHAVLVTSDFHMERAKLIFTHVLPYIDFKYVVAKTLVSEIEFQRLIQYEKIAIKREVKSLRAIEH